MRILRSLCLVFLSSIVIDSYSPVNAQILDFTKLVNPFTGTGDHRHTYPASENSGWDFSGIRDKARNKWNQYLSKNRNRRYAYDDWCLAEFVNKMEVDVIEGPIIGNALNYEAEEVMRCLNEGLKESPFMPLDESIRIMGIMDKIRRPWELVYPNDNME